LKGHWFITSREAQNEQDMRFDFLYNTASLYKNFILYWLPVILWMCVIFWMSTGMFSSEHTSRFIVPILHFLFPSLFPQEIDMIHEVIRKAGHITEYFILGLFLFRAFRKGSSQVWNLRWAIYSVIWIVFYAGSDELHQWFVSDRNASLMDIGIDSVGGILSQIAITQWHLRKKPRGSCTLR
jgi:VanZ family protein